MRDLALVAPEHMLEVHPHGVQNAVRFFEQLSWPSPRVKIMSPTADIVVKAARINGWVPFNLSPTTDIVVILRSGPGGLEDGAPGLTSIN